MEASTAHSNKLSLHNISLKWPILWCFSATLILFYKALQEDYYSLHCPLVKLWGSAFCHLVFSWLTLKDRQFSFLGGHPRPLLAGVSLLQHQPVSGKCYTVQSGHLIHETCSGAKFCASPHPLMAEAILGVSFTSGLDSLLFWTLQVSASFSS